MTEEEILEVERKIGYNFHDRTLLIAAFTHKSYVNEHPGTESYNRLEYLGDAILGFLTAEKQYDEIERLTDAEMTAWRQRVVSEEPLCAIVSGLDIMRFMRTGNGSKKDAMNSDKNNSDLFEALLAAVYLDSGRSLAAARAFVDRHLGETYRRTRSPG